MKTRLTSSCRNRCFELVIDDGAPTKERRVLASMTLFEGDGLWMLTDIRLHRHRRPSPCSGGLFADDVSCFFKPDNEDESRFVQGLLRECTVDAEGVIHWSSFEGLVRGPRRGGCTWSKTDHNGIGYFSRAEGLAHLKEIQAFWAGYDGDPALAKIDNPHRQLGQSDVWARAFMRRPKVGVSQSGRGLSSVVP